MKWLTCLSFLMILGIFLGLALAGPYTDSIHGNSTYGVYRNSTYARGNCAHCHQMHTTPNPFALFANNFNTSVITGPYVQSDDFCFYCHGSPSVQIGGITNYDYSTTFGKAPANATTIMDAFNQASYHDLYDIWNFAQTAFPSFFTNSSNPCVACHNPHIVKRSCGYPGITFDSNATAISRPTDHDQLWGDNATEKMSYYAAGYIYQPTYCYNSTYFEPDCTSNDTLLQAQKTPDYVSFCTDCHNTSNVIYSHELGRDLKYIDWENEKHGKGPADGTISVHPPFTNASIGQYVLSCLDCHEPHGSPNLYLIRREVNGDLLYSTVGTGYGDLGYLCRQCHLDDAAAIAGAINSWEYIHHYSPDYPYIRKSCTTCHYSFPIRCTDCHYHNSTATDSWGVVRRTF